MDNLKTMPVSYCERLWAASEKEFPKGLKVCPESGKKKNEKQIRNIMNQFSRQMKRFTDLAENTEGIPEPSPAAKAKWREQSEALIRKFTNQNLCGMDTIGLETKELFLNISKEFVKKTRAFDDALPMEDIWQALRNFLVYAMFGELLGREPECQNAIWGYSLLYPYTDNFLDDPGISKQDKKEFNQNLYRRLLGEAVLPGSERERKVYALIEGIEGIYPRESFQGVYKSILWIYEAQAESLIQQDGFHVLSEEEIKKISILKGGSSVLADRFLVDGRPEPEEYDFYLGFGFFLQLADDLQDLEEDMAKNHQTLPVYSAKNGSLELLINKIASYLMALFEDLECKNDTIKNFIFNNSLLLLIGSTYLCGKYISREYALMLQSYFPVRFDFIDELKGSLEDKGFNTDKNQERLMQILDELVV